MKLYVVNKHFLNGTRGFNRYAAGSSIVGVFHDLEESKTFMDKEQKDNPSEFYFVNDVYNKKIIYMTEDGWINS